MCGRTHYVDDETLHWHKSRVLSSRCTDNGLLGYSEDSDTFPQGPFCDGGGEADCPQHCDECGVFLENPLTPDGVRYVAETIENTDPQNDVVRLWAEFYGADYPGLEFTQLS